MEKTAHNFFLDGRRNNKAAASSLHSSVRVHTNTWRSGRGKTVEVAHLPPNLPSLYTKKKKKKKKKRES
jgi:hypothetical protein